MNRDIRLLVSFRDHRKRKRFEHILGPGATGYLIDLWLTAAEDRPDGVLHGWDEIDIAFACGYPDEPKKLIEALLECCWIDKGDDGVYILHGWGEYQGWCLGSEFRSNKARINALIKHFGRKAGLKKAVEQYGINPADYGYKDAASMLPAKEQHAKQDAPSPSPSPSQTTLYEFYVSKIEPQRKSSKRAQNNIKKHLKKFAFDDLNRSVLNYKSTLNGIESQFRKDPANFFGINEPYFIDYLPKNFSQLPPPDNLSQKEITPENAEELYAN